MPNPALDQSVYLFNIGENFQAYKTFGAHPVGRNAKGEADQGYHFVVWAPKAKELALCGDFNDWNQLAMTPVGSSGVWQVVCPEAKQWDRYKYAVTSEDGRTTLKADPFARHAETRPNTASIVYDAQDYTWSPQEAHFDKTLPDVYHLGPCNIYEIHIGSWRRYPDGNVYNYRDLADQLAPYLTDMGYNYVELMPITEYPLDASWGYQCTGFFSPTSRYGTPDDLKYFIDRLHQAGIRVILDWVPAHFPKDAFGLFEFDGTSCYEYEDPILREHKEWGTMVFDFGKKEVQSFLISSANFWLSEFHFDGIRADAISSMLYLNYGRETKLTNQYGDERNLDAVAFLQKLNGVLHETHPKALLVAEESTAWPKVTRNAEEGGLGFTHKWNMGWMNDTLDFFSRDYYSRSYHKDEFTFSIMYAYSENFILPISHDEVVHGKKSVLDKMPGDYWRKFASLRTMELYQRCHPGKKLNFMGNEFAPFIEWRHYEELEWFLLAYPQHKHTQDYIRALNHYYLQTPALWELDDSPESFTWMKLDDVKNSVFAFVRKARDGSEVMIVLNLTPASFDEYLFSLPIFYQNASFEVILNSDEKVYGGSGFIGHSVAERKTRDLLKVGYAMEGRIFTPDLPSLPDSKNWDDEPSFPLADQDPSNAGSGVQEREPLGQDEGPLGQDEGSSVQEREPSAPNNENHKEASHVILNMMLPPLCGIIFSIRQGR